MWEWRAFAARFDGLEALIDAAASVEARTDIYVVGPSVGPGRGLKLRGQRDLELKLRVALDAATGCERWEKPFHEALPAEPWRMRELARLASPGGPVPVRPLRDAAGLLRWADDVRLGPARLVTVDKRLRGALLEGGVRLEHGALAIIDAGSAEARPLETVCLVGPTAAALVAARARLALPPGARACGWPELLLGPR